MEKKPIRTNGQVFAAMFLGICIIISSTILGSRISDLNKTLTEKQFYSDPVTEIKTTDINDSPYLTVDEAAQYLKMTTTDVNYIITNGQISGYIKLQSGDYVISKTALDEWFKNNAADLTKGT